MHFFYLGWVQCSNSSHLRVQILREEKESGDVDRDINLHRNQELCHKVLYTFSRFIPINMSGHFVIISFIRFSSFMFTFEQFQRGRVGRPELRVDPSGKDCELVVSSK